MEHARLGAVALVAALFIACTNTETTTSGLDALPEQGESSATARQKKDAPEGEDTLDDSSEKPLVGQVESAPGSGSPGTPASTSPLCGTGLTCNATSVGGAQACRQSASSVGDVFCCPNVGDRIVNGVCVAKLCGSGLTCSASSTKGASACRQTTSSTNDIFCCPIAGWRIQNGECIPPLCGTGLTCSASPTVGAPACRQTTTSTSNVFCCPATGAKIVNGQCQ